MKLDLSDVKRGSRIALDGTPYIVMSAKHMHMGRGGAVVQAKVRDLKTGKIFDKTIKPSDTIEEAEVEKMNAQFIYERNGEYWFHEPGKPGNRFSLSQDVLGEQAVFLKENMEITALLFEGKIINIVLPVKADYKVTEAPPNVKGNTSQTANKIATIEGGAKVNVPLFVETGDTVRVNTETGEYSERVND